MRAALVTAASLANVATSQEESGWKGCWRDEQRLSHHFLCCGRVPGEAQDADDLPRPDCWGDSGVARGNEQICCNSTRIALLDAKVYAATHALDPSPCSGASPEVQKFLQDASERILYEGKLFSGGISEEGDEGYLIRDADATYEACPPALLLAMLARASRWLANKNYVEGDMYVEAYQLWGGLRWSSALCWNNLQDPLVMQVMGVALLQFKVFHALMSRPADMCFKFIGTLADMMNNAKGLSLTVSEKQGQNLHSYPALAKSAMVLTSYGHLTGSDAAEYCDPARLCAHVFMARRLLDIKSSVARQHLEASRVLSALPAMHSTEAGHMVWSVVLKQLFYGLAIQQTWLRQASWWVSPEVENKSRTLPALPTPIGGPALAPLTMWERTPAPVFSEGLKDQVFERLFGILGVTNRYYVEIGTQSGEQCNTRYLRVRYGFTGLMVDDNWENLEIFQVRHRVTPSNAAKLFQRYAVPEKFDILSLDTDGYEWLLWLHIHRASYLPRVVVIEFGADLPFNQDAFVRYTDFPVHQLCLANGNFPRVAGASMAGVLKLGNSLGYHLVHLINGGTTDLIFVHRDVLNMVNVTFPAQDNLHGLCALAAFQTGSASGDTDSCADTWTGQGPAPPKELLTDSTAVLAGDYHVPESWDRKHLRDVFC